MCQIINLCLVMVMTCAATRSVDATKDERQAAYDSRTQGGILQADLGLFLKELGTVVATTDHMFINVAVEVPNMN